MSQQLMGNQGSGAQSLNFVSKNNDNPGGIFKRLVALIIDGFFISLITYPLFFVLMIPMVLIIGNDQSSPIFVVFNLVITLISLAVSLFSLGWFNKNKGGSPGKLVFGMKVVDMQTGEYLSYKQTFIRMFVGQWIVCTLTMGIGYLIAIFRKDKRGLHDMVAGTQVLEG